MFSTATKKIILSGIFASLLALTAWSQETHLVDRNQTLWAIAKLYGVSINDLMVWNQLKSTSLRPGQTLIVKPALPPGASPALASVYYTVKDGDSLSELSIKYGTSLDDLKRLNGLTSLNIRSGQKLMIRQPFGITTYTVQTGDSLSLLAARFQISQQDLIDINQLGGLTLRVGQEIRVFKPKERPLNHEVLAMDTVPGVAALYNMEPAQLRQLNGLSGNSLKKGTILNLRDYAPAASPGILGRQLNPEAAGRTVTAPEAPLRPAAVIEEDQPAATPETGKAASATWTVAAGDTLYRIAKASGVKVADLMAWNKLDNGKLKVGQKLVLAPLTAPPARETSQSVNTVLPAGLTRPAAPISFPDETAPAAEPKTEEKKAPVSKISFPDFEEKDRESLTWDNLVVLDKAIPLYEWNNDYYYWTHPGELTQPSSGYYENDWPSPLTAYKKARKLWDGFAALVAKRPFKTKLLKGYTIVLDAGHGGLDPGAIVKSTDGSGDSLFVTEDEYVYDIALRMYVLLKEHGAEVQLTTLAPNHLIRDTTPATRTLIHEKNEVFNALELNKEDKADNWIAGGPKGLEKRVSLAEKFFENTPVGKRIFLSLHADNDPRMPMGTGVLTFEKGTAKDQKSQKFGEALLPFLGKGAYTRTEDLGVLRGNPADYKALIEIRNVSYPEHSWALRFANTRQLDAQKLVRGLLEYFDR